MAAPNTCTVTGSLYDILGQVEASNAKLLVDLTVPFFYGENLIQPAMKTADVDEDGQFSIDLVETTTYTPSKPYVFKLTYTTDEGVSQTINLGTGTVPAEDTAPLSSFLTIGEQD